VVIARDLLEPGVIEALNRGGRVVLLSLPGHGLHLPGYEMLKPGVTLGWWAVSNQAGTALARHPAFGDFPNDGYLEESLFRLVDHAAKLDSGHGFREVDPLMVGIGRETGYQFGFEGYPLGFNLYAFQANAGAGKLLATGLNLTSDFPEAVYLLDQFIRYARSPAFRPKGRFDLNEFCRLASNSQLLNQRPTAR
jgi:hypothetical protein